MERKGTAIMTDEGALILWGAIWKAAMREELGACKAFISNELRQQGIKNPHKLIKKFDHEIFRDVSQKILQEADDYPHGHTGRYNYRRLSNQLIEFVRSPING